MLVKVFVKIIMVPNALLFLLAVEKIFVFTRIIEQALIVPELFHIAAVVEIALADVLVSTENLAQGIPIISWVLRRLPQFLVFVDLLLHRVHVQLKFLHFLCYVTNRISDGQIFAIVHEGEGVVGQKRIYQFLVVQLRVIVNLLSKSICS